MNRRRRLLLPSLLLICVGLALACAGGGEQSAPVAKTKGLKWVESETTHKSGSGGYVSGIVRNMNKHKVTGVRITFKLSQGGAKTGMATDKTPSLEPGERWKFTAKSLGKPFDKYELVDLDCK